MLYAAMAVYVVLAPAIFFGTLGAAHGAMDKAKKRWLSDISAQFHGEHDRTVPLLAQDPEAVAVKVERISQLRELYQLTNSFPVWPFDTGTLSRFAAVVAAPLVPIVITVLADALISTL